MKSHTWHLEAQGRPRAAAKLVGVPVGENPTRGTCPVAPVVISGGGARDQSAGSPEAKVLVGWVKTWSAPTGGRAKRPRSRISKPVPRFSRIPKRAISVNPRDEDCCWLARCWKRQQPACSAIDMAAKSRSCFPPPWLKIVVRVKASYNRH